MNYLHVLILAIIQGLCELLPVSSSAHVIVAAKLMGEKPIGSPEMSFLIIMLHTGTMFAVIVYFWQQWRRDYFASRATFVETLKQVIIATACTAVVGLGLKAVIEKVFMRDQAKAEIELLFDNLTLIAAALFTVGILIFIAGWTRRETGTPASPIEKSGGQLAAPSSTLIGIVQGLCLPFRGFSRSGATISTGLLLGISRAAAERFSFALAVVLTPPLVGREALRLLKANKEALANGGTPLHFGPLLAPGLVGMVFSFLAGLVALKWLSQWLETGKWQWFGVYCLIAAGVVFFLATRGY